MFLTYFWSKNLKLVAESLNITEIGTLSKSHLTFSNFHFTVMATVKSN